jgi:hypothetical protein
LNYRLHADGNPKHLNNLTNGWPNRRLPELSCCGLILMLNCILLHLGSHLFSFRARLVRRPHWRRDGIVEREAEVDFCGIERYGGFGCGKRYVRALLVAYPLTCLN